jgi:hypothetical protein
LAVFLPHESIPFFIQAFLPPLLFSAKQLFMFLFCYYLSSFNYFLWRFIKWSQFWNVVATIVGVVKLVIGDTHKYHLSEIRLFKSWIILCNVDLSFLLTFSCLTWVVFVLFIIHLKQYPKIFRETKKMQICLEWILWVTDYWKSFFKSVNFRERVKRLVYRKFGISIWTYRKSI